MINNRLPHLTLASALFLTVVSHGFSQDCELGFLFAYTDDFSFSATSNRGAKGDVVAIDLSLRVSKTHGDLDGLGIIACYDREKAELLDHVLYTDEFERVAFIRFFSPIGDGTRVRRADGGLGFVLAAAFDSQLTEQLGTSLVSGGVLPIGTVFFRLTGEPGDVFDVSFCDREFFDDRKACQPNTLVYSPGVNETLSALSNRHDSAIVEIIEGAPTQPEIPDLPPPARVYPGEPSEGSAGILFESTGGVAQPGGRISVDVYVTSKLEFTGFEVSLRFPQNYLELRNVEERTRPSLTLVDNHEGHLAMVMVSSHRRVGAENERVHLATLSFDVSEAAADVNELVLRFEDHGDIGARFGNSLLIRYEDPDLARTVASEAKVEPVLITDGLLMIQSEPTTPGDVNLDYDVTLTDAIALLGGLFRGERSIVCPAAADFDEDGRVNITDAVGILLHLFGSRPRTLDTKVFCSGNS